CGSDHRARDEARAARRPHPRIWRESDPLLRTCAQERSLRFVRGDAARGHPQPGNLYRRGARRPDPSGRCRRRRWRDHLRHEDAGNRRGVRHARHEADYPLSFRFDETDTVLVCDLVKVPWERVFLHNNGAMSRRIYIETPANCYQNHQSNVRFWAKMGLIVGLASRMCQANGVDKIPAVRETLGRLAALEATIGGLVSGQIEAYEQWPDGYATPNRRI